MTRSVSPLLVLGVAPIFILFSGCRGCEEDDKVAELLEQNNSVMRDFGGQAGRWRKANRGDVFRIGDGLKTGKAAHARLRISPEGEMLVQSDTLVRFQTTAPGEQARRIQVETGSVEIDSDHSAFQIRTEVGLARIERGSRLQLKSNNNASELRVLVGNVELDRQGKKVSVAAGQTLSVDVGGVIIDKETTPTKPVSKVDKQPAPPVPDAEAPQAPESEVDKTLVAAEAGSRADVSVVAGESATIHDPTPPTQVRIPITGCAAGGVVEVGRRGSGYRLATIRGAQTAVVRLPVGSYQYRVRCTASGSERAQAPTKGSLIIMRDAGLRQLPKKPADISIDADGRSYTVRYQNLLPKITFVWPEAPVSKAYTIHLTSKAGAARKEQSSQPRFTYNSGKLGEGAYQFFFSESGGRRSQTGKLTIAFDNSARTASLSEPVEGKAQPGQKVAVSGTVLTNSRVSIHGAAIATDAQGRFKAEVVTPAEADAIAVRVQHSATKIHYYLRHLSSNKQ